MLQVTSFRTSPSFRVHLRLSPSQYRAVAIDLQDARFQYPEKIKKDPRLFLSVTVDYYFGVLPIILLSRLNKKREAAELSVFFPAYHLQI